MHTLRPVPRGDFRPYIGVRIDGTPQRFHLGKDPRRAELLDRRIPVLYQESEAIRLTYALSLSSTAAALHAAKLIHNGLERLPLPAAAVIHEAAGDGPDMAGFKCAWTIEKRSPEALVWAHAVASRQYANLAFPTLFEEQKEYRKFLRPVFDAVKK